MVEDSVEILDVTFLTPALVKLKLNGQEIAVQVSADIVNRKVYSMYSNSGEEFYSEQIFDYLDTVNALPDDFFMAPESIVEQAAEAQAHHEKLRREHGEG